MDRFCTELYEYDPANDTWNQLRNFQLAGINYSSMRSIAGELIVFAGIDTNKIVYNDLWKFNPSNLQCMQKASLPSFARKGGMSLTNGTDFYYSTRIDQTNNRLVKTWKVVDPTSISPLRDNLSIKIFPNPSRERIAIINNDQEELNVQLLNLLGETLLLSGKLELDEHQKEIDLSQFPPGTYILQQFLTKNPESII